MSNRAPASPSTGALTAPRLFGGADARKASRTLAPGYPRCVLAYHEIVPSASRYLYGVSAAQFEEHTALLASSELPAKPAVEITFDDGHRSNFEVALPLLDRVGLSATFFVLAGCLGSSDQYMTWEHARELTAAGHSVQSHGWSHRLLTQCDDRELDDELVRSKQTLEDRLGIAVDSISAPGGRWDDRVAAACARAGYTHLFHSNPWASPRNLGGLSLQGRVMITEKMTANILRKQMQVGGARRAYLSSKYRLKDGVRSLLGDQRYHRLWCWLANFDSQDGLEVQVASRPSGNKKSVHP